jgi:hypothetical protein
MIPTSEIHLFLIWKKGLPQANMILDEIKQDFTVLDVQDIVWERRRIVQNLCRFYTNSKLIIFWKYLRCGGAPVRMILVKDKAPTYMDRQTNAGIEKVNIHMFDSKKKYRKLMKNGHLIHGTNTTFEFMFNYMMLTGKAPNIKKINKMPEWNGVITKNKTEMPGTRPWKDFDELFSFIKNLDTFIVLRNFENLPASCQLGPHSDIDILTSTPKEFVRLLNLKRASLLPFRAIWRTPVADSFINMDIRSIQDGYYPTEIAQHLLNNKTINQNGIPIPLRKDYFYTLLYHALIHKYKIAKDYKKRLLNMGKEFGLYPPSGKNTEIFFMETLHKWMKDHNFSFTEPKDLTVNFNSKYTIDCKTSRLRKLKDFLFSFQKKEIY